MILVPAEQDIRSDLSRARPKPRLQTMEYVKMVARPV